MRGGDFGEFLKAVLPAMGYCWKRFDRRNVRRRVRTRMDSLRVHDLDHYARLVMEDPDERAVLDSLLRLTITRFFRNSWLWSDLEVLIPRIAGVLEGKGPLGIWSAGCAGGEEPFTIAMLLDDLSRAERLECPWTVVGTDSDKASLERASGTEYKWGSVRETPAHILDRWFEKKGELWSLAEEVRAMVKICHHDLLSMDPPGEFHMVFLRNSILTYNLEEIRRAVLVQIRSCLLEPGYLIIGRTETLPEGTGFEETSRSIYRKT